MEFSLKTFLRGKKIEVEWEIIQITILRIFFSFSFLSCLDLSVNNNGKTAVFLKRTFYKGVFFLH